MTLLQQVIAELERVAPPAYQEDYDNSGLLCGSGQIEVLGVLVSLDCTEAVVDEAIAKNCNVIVAHHPLIFGGLKKLSGDGYVQKALVKAIKNDIAIYACHTNIDNVESGVNAKIAAKLGLKNCKILSPKKGLLRKLVTYVPLSHHQAVLDALFAVGAGTIGNYSHCSFNTQGKGTFKGNEKSTPFIGTAGVLSNEDEIKIETIFAASDERKVLMALFNSHPYEEVAYDIYSLENEWASVGSGMIGELPVSTDELSFLQQVKRCFNADVLKYTPNGKPIKKVAICGGSGRFLLNKAVSSGADAFITADFKYHEYFDALGRILLIDTGHFENEQFTPEIFSEIILNKFSTFAVRLSEINTNPVKYF